jgi:hypothetical protein
LARQYFERTWQDKRIREFTDNKETQDFIQSLVNELNINSDKSSYLPEDIGITKKGARGVRRDYS